MGVKQKHTTKKKFPHTFFMKNMPYRNYRVHIICSDVHLVTYLNQRS